LLGFADVLATRLFFQVFACKMCKKCFRKDMTQFEEPDEYCPHCGNCFVVEAVTPETLQEERLQKRLLRAAAVKEAERKNKMDQKNDKLKAGGSSIIDDQVQDKETKLPSIDA
jgi:tRNA G26 N,N-dimethylase Trm1|tara:strand:+ start:324 stop:662 length:339 start_codon:yes stop_codon:yes gene_type:complete